MAGLHPYVPGEQPKDRKYIKLNANENPYPPSPKVVEALNAFVAAHPEKLALYPDPDSLSLHAEIAHMLNATGGVLCRTHVQGEVCTPDVQDALPFTVTPDMIYTGNGSDEVLSFVFYAFFDNDRPLVLPTFTYSFYPVYAGFYGVPLEQVSLHADWSLDVQTMLAKAQEYDSSIIFANPNAPTGLGLTRSQVRAMIQQAPKDKVFVVDEAYVDFGGESCIPLLAEFPNLVVVRTFSKSLCGAGMRLGYLVAAPELIQAVTTVKNSLNHFPIDAVSQVAGCAACKDTAYYVQCAKRVAEERDSFAAFLRDKGWNVLPSQTNFIFVQKSGIDGHKAYEHIKNDGILVRHFNTPGIENFLRITIGTPEQMQALRTVMADL